MVVACLLDMGEHDLVRQWTAATDGLVAIGALIARGTLNEFQQDRSDAFAAVLDEQIGRLPASRGERDNDTALATVLTGCADGLEDALGLTADPEIGLLARLRCCVNDWPALEGAQLAAWRKFLLEVASIMSRRHADAYGQPGDTVVRL